MKLKHVIIWVILSYPMQSWSLNGANAEPFAPFRSVQKIVNVNGSSGDRFGEKIAVAGDTIAVVARDDDSLATDAGMVYLFTEEGDPTGSFGSPNPEEGGRFGFYISNVGDDRFLISANWEDSRSGRVYLYESQGGLLATLTAPEPLPDREFGGRGLIATESSLFIGSWAERVRNDHESTRTGVMYEYNHHGGVVSRIDHPRPDTGTHANCLGRSAALVSSELILVGDACADLEGFAGAGSAFLFDLEGELQHTFGNPNPAALDSFGASVAAAEGRILIGGFQIDDLDNNASTGAAYIYETDGTLVTRVSDPEPRGGNWFGWNAGSMTLRSGEEVFLVGSIFNSTRFSSAGKAFIINRDGEILQSLESPSPEPGDNFGADFAQLGNKLLIGTPQGSSAGTGAVWVFEQADLGDFDLDGTIDEFDLEILCGDLVSGEITESWDITGDSTIDHQDLTEFLALAPFLPGDADFDGEVTFADFLDLSSNFGDPDATEWTDGNFNCSGHVDFGDFLLLSGNFGESVKAQVPEPNANAWIILVFASLVQLRPHRRRQVMTP